MLVFTSVAELHHFNAASAPENFFDAVPATAALAPASTLLYSRSTFGKQTKVNPRIRATFTFVF
jgi:hypothetical protein